MAKVKNIHCISRASVKIGDSFFTVEYGEDRELELDEDITEARKQLWDDCNNEVDSQILEIKETFNSHRH